MLQPPNFEPRPWTADDGTLYPPIVWGSETNEWKGMARKYSACPGCGVVKGEFHYPGCRVEQIPAPLTVDSDYRPIVITDRPGWRLRLPTLNPALERRLVTALLGVVLALWMLW